MNKKEIIEDLKITISGLSIYDLAILNNIVIDELRQRGYNNGDTIIV